MRDSAGHADVAIVGGGIMGCTLALYLARAGHRVTLFDASDDLIAGASRWNEGKIHLGFLYGADPSLSTARSVLPGGLSFAPLIEELIGTSIDGHITTEDDTYLIHRDSVVSAEDAQAYFRALLPEVKDAAAHGRYLSPLDDAEVRALGEDEIAELASPGTVTGGATVPERSIDTQWLADRLAAAVRAEPRIDVKTATRVTSVTGADGATDRWTLATGAEGDRSFDVVVNAAWHGLLALDRSAGLPPEADWSHRYRVSAFIRTAREVRTPSAVLAVGPFGDVKCYDGRSFYVSWYPAGLLDESRALEPVAHTAPEGAAARAVVEAIRVGIVPLMPWVDRIFDEAEEIRIEGGHVFARASGDLSEAGASIHRRDKFGVTRRGTYFSVDTGKYSSAPLIAKSLAAQISGTD